MISSQRDRVTVVSENTTPHNCVRTDLSEHVLEELGAPEYVYTLTPKQLKDLMFWAYLEGLNTPEQPVEKRPEVPIITKRAYQLNARDFVDIAHLVKIQDPDNIEFITSAESNFLPIKNVYHPSDNTYLIIFDQGTIEIPKYTELSAVHPTPPLR